VISITRRETFSAAHRLFNPAFSEEKNRHVFGLCSNPHGHGHNYVIEVTLTGEPDAATGYLFDLGELSEVIRRRVLDDVDHRNLNAEVSWLEGCNPTTEVLADAMWNRLDAALPPGLLTEIVVRETEKNWATRRRDP
jgi:6-pyruvoyltetrahydropterin/6-carboxytetrahydropterin synthase